MTTAKTTAAAKTTATKKTSAPKTATPTKKIAAVKKTAAAKTEKPSKISDQERYRMIEVAAYFLAERNSFKGSPVEYWVAAEAQIAKLLTR